MTAEPRASVRPASSGLIPVPRVISAAGFVTRFGGGALSPRVQAAISEAMSHTWRVDDLQAWAGGVIAEATGAEAGWVTSGAAAGLSLAAAACIAGIDPARMAELPGGRGAEPEILMLRGHRNAYDHAYRVAGARIVDVGYPFSDGVGLTYAWQLESAIGPATVAIGFMAKAESPDLPLAEVCRVAHAHGIRVIVDAAAELPPKANLRRFIADGADAVVFSGGKAIRGPQASGVLAGRRNLISSVRLQALDMDVDRVEWRRAHGGGDPPHHGLGRGFKVGKEEIAGLATALQEFVDRDLDAERDEMARWLEQVATNLGPGARVDLTRHFNPRLVISAGGEPEARAWSARLAGLDPAVLTGFASLRRGELVVVPDAISPEDREYVGAALVRTRSGG